jgi:DNA-binding MarR family transcriptional regulator
MTGGRRRDLEEDCVHPYFVRPVVLTEQDRSTDAALLVWLEAARFRRAANRALRAYNVSFSQWRLLHATERLVRETLDAVSELDLARYTEMDVNTVSAVMHRLTRKGLLSWGPDAWGFSLRILATDQGKALLASTRGEVLRSFRDCQLSDQNTRRR